MSHTTENLGMVSLNLHAPAATVTPLPASQVCVNQFGVDRQAGRQTLDDGDKSLAM
jgi:hypothetical protein